MAGIVAEGIRLHHESMRRFYEASGAPCYVHSYSRHEVHFPSQTVPGVTLVIDVMVPHYTDRAGE